MREKQIKNYSLQEKKQIQRQQTNCRKQEAYGVTVQVEGDGEDERTEE